MDFAELLASIQIFVDRRRVEVENDIRAQLVEMSEEEIRELPQVTYDMALDGENRMVR